MKLRTTGGSLLAVFLVFLVLVAWATPSPVNGQDVRARDLGVSLGILPPAPLNAITDVEGVEVGHATIIEGEGLLQVGEGPARTGVTAVFSRGRTSGDTAFAGWFAFNGNGEMTGSHWIEESGLLTTPVLITDTHSVGVARDASIEWMLEHRGEIEWALPVVAETFGFPLNDVNGFHVKREHVFEALDAATGGPVPEGNVGGGTGMVCFNFKGGIGTASRKLPERWGGWTVGVLVQCNYGWKRLLRVDGVPVGRQIERPTTCVAMPRGRWPERLLNSGGLRAQGDPWMPCPEHRQEGSGPPSDGSGAGTAAADRPLTEGYGERSGRGSIIAVVATDAPLLPIQLKRITRRVATGLGRLGDPGANGSGDFYLAFSTGNAGLAREEGVTDLEYVPNAELSPLFLATAEAAEEAVVNALVAAETMEGADRIRIRELPHDRLREILSESGQAPDAAGDP